MEEELGYDVLRRYVDAEMQRYVREYRDVDKFEALCRQCGNYGRCWGCPPFEFDVGALLESYRSIRIYASIITPVAKNIPLNRTQELILPERSNMEQKLLEMEKLYGGRAFAFVGKCLYCNTECARIKGKPCLHPDLVRPSLEGYGFDLTKTLKDFFSLEFLWSSNGYIPEQLILISAFAHNEALPNE